jgi:hypothetical protein
MTISIKKEYITFNDDLNLDDSVIKAEPVIRPIGSLYIASPSSAFVMTDLPNSSLFIYFAEVRGTASASFFRFRWSADNGTNWSQYWTLSETVDWRTYGVWGRLTRPLYSAENFYSNPPTMAGFGIETENTNAINFFNRVETINNISLTSRTMNAMEFSFSSGTFAGGSTGQYNQFHFFQRKDVIV